MSWWKQLLKYSSCVSISVWVEEMEGSREKTRKDGFIENFYDLISGVSDLIVEIIVHIIRLISIHKQCNFSVYSFQISCSVSNLATPGKRNMQSIEVPNKTN